MKNQPQVSSESNYKRSLFPWKVYRFSNEKWHLANSYRRRKDAEEYAVILRRSLGSELLVEVVFEQIIECPTCYFTQVKHDLGLNSYRCNRCLHVWHGA